MANVADALDELRRRAAAAGGTGEEPDLAGDTIEPDLQRDLLVAWAREKRLDLIEAEWLPRKQDSHGEHHVFLDTDKQRYFKITHDSRDENAAGFAIAIGLDDIIMTVQSQRYMCVPYIRDATAFEYLSRLVVFNRTFGDDIQLEGVICDPVRVAIVTSQPVIRGRAASADEVKAAMNEWGFVLSDCPPLGRKNVASPSFYNPAERIAVFDTHAANFLVNEGVVAPIDALITPMDEYLEFYLSLSSTERKKEIGQWTSQMHGF
jgi:hypothetical protein